MVAPCLRPQRGGNPRPVAELGPPPEAMEAMADEWTHPYDRATAAFPMGATADKHWPPVGRIDRAHGAKNLVCSCPEIDNYR